MNLIEGAKTVIEVLNQNGFDAYIVGGYVRDYLINRPSGDIDIATNALPSDVAKCFKKTINTGLKHGTVTVLFENNAYEVTTFRTESTYVGNRKPETVTFVRTLKEDILRRDFTMNALALTKDDKVIDYVDGREHIKNKHIKTVGEANLRFSEDALRMLRAFRFVSTLDFQVDEDIKAAIKQHGELIQNISLERIIKEFENMIKGEFFLKAIEVMIETNFHTALSLFKNGLENINKTKLIPIDLLEFLSIVAVSDSIETIERLPIPNFIKKEVRVIHNMFEVEITQFSKPILFRNGLRNCHIVNKLNVHLRNKIDLSEQINSDFKYLPIKKQCDLMFKGDQIIELYNRTPGIWIAEILDEICLKVLLGELENDYEKIKQYLMTKQS